MEGRACYPLGFDPDGDDGPQCSARSPGSLGLFDAGDPSVTAVRGGGLGSLGLIDGTAGLADGGVGQAPTMPADAGLEVGSDADEALIILAAEAAAGNAARAGFLETTAENLARFTYKDWARWPRSGEQLAVLAEELRAFGGVRMYVHDQSETAGSKAARVLVWKGNPRAARAVAGIAEMIRGVGPHPLLGTRVVQLGLGTRIGLRARLSGRVTSLAVAAPLAGLRALFEDEVALDRLGVSLGGGIAALVKAGFSELGSAFDTKPGDAETDKSAVPPVVLVAGGGSVAALTARDATATRENVQEWRGRVRALEDGLEFGIRALVARLAFCAAHPDAGFGA